MVDQKEAKAAKKRAVQYINKNGLAGCLKHSNIESKLPKPSAGHSWYEFYIPFSLATTQSDRAKGANRLVLEVSANKKVGSNWYWTDDHYKTFHKG